MNKIAVSSGAACSSLNPAPSHVLKALGVERSLIKSTIRIGIGRFNTKDEISWACDYMIAVIKKASLKSFKVKKENFQEING